ncbi:MAG TPA: exodeoxyribonuclease VII large subunit, partial [Myxococcota bacterium]|nr:exodeoxyribonuclease VII large subunit [Myxococcota bacterium]
RLQAAARRQVERGTARLLRVQPRPPTDRIRAGRQRAENLQLRLQRAMVALLRGRRDHLGAQAGRLSAMSPLQVLERGYALALRDGRALRSAAEVEVGERLELRLHRGRLGVRVEEREEGLEST